jgi:hypothetical protein
MIVANSGYFTTLHPEGKSGIKMECHCYNVMKEFVLDLLRAEGEVSFSVFLQSVHSHFVNELGVNTGWFLYHVKLDMEARKLIKHERPKNRRQHLSTIRLIAGRTPRSKTVVSKNVSHTIRLVL